MVAYALDWPYYTFDLTRTPRSDLVEDRIAALLDRHGIEYYYEAAHYPHGWDEFGHVTEASNPDFHLPATVDRPAIEIEATLIGHPELPLISGGKYSETRGRAALRRKRRQAGLRLYQYGINTLIIDWPLCQWLAANPDGLLPLIERTARRRVIMTHRLVA